MELICLIRLMVAAEYEAIQLYMQLTKSTGNELAKTVLTDVAKEEREYAGEFLRLLHELALDEQHYYDYGKGEVEEIIVELKKAKTKTEVPPQPKPTRTKFSG